MSTQSHKTSINMIIKAWKNPEYQKDSKSQKVNLPKAPSALESLNANDYRMTAFVNYTENGPACPQNSL